MVPDLVSVMTCDPDAELRVVESVPGGSKKEYEVSGHAEIVKLLVADDDAELVVVPEILPVRASGPDAVLRVVESVPGGSEKE